MLTQVTPDRLADALERRPLHLVAIAPYWSTWAPGWIIVSLLQIGFGVSPLHSIRPTSLAAAPPPASQVPAGGVTRPSRTSQPAGTVTEAAMEQ